MNKYNLYSCFDHWCSDGSIYIYSDPHFADDEMKYLRKNYIGDDEQAKRINSKIGKKDTIIFLGDIGNIDLVKKIRGYKVLIKGNHDTGSSNYKKDLKVEYYDRTDDINAQYGSAVISLVQPVGVTIEQHINYIANTLKISYIAAKEIVYTGRHLYKEYAIISINNNPFDEVYDGPLMIGEKIILSHEPIKNINWALNIHGHDHSNIEVNDDYHLNLCAEHINYTPVCLKHIIESGVLKNIDSIHRITIDKATENKRKKKNND